MIQTLAEQATSWLEDRVTRLGARSVYLPAGKTPRVLYRHWEEQAPRVLEGLSFVQIDDVIRGPKTWIFERFLIATLPSYTKKLVTIRSQAEHKEPIIADLAILGLGRNGHVAFHEPGIPASFCFGCVRLEDESVRGLGFSAQSVWGLTYGLGAFLRCRAILLLVSGRGKERALKALKLGDLSYPVVHLLKHKDLTVLSSVDTA